MPKELIENIAGTITNVDLEDIPKDHAIAINNLLPRNGKLIKTHGFGDRFDLNIMDVIDDDNNPGGVWDDSQVWEDGKYWIDQDLTKILSGPIKNIAVYTHEDLRCPVGSGHGYVYIVVIIDGLTGEVTLKYWNGERWADISDLLQNTLGSFYHKNDQNPIIQANNILRLLPGNVGEIGGNEARGIWIGKIDTDFFDGILAAGTEAEVDAGTKDYQKGFFGYATDLERPDLDFIATLLWRGDYSPEGTDDIRYYKFSYVYDGVQESLLTEEPLKVSFYIHNAIEFYLRLQFSINKLTHNKRITAMKVYRCDTPDGEYLNIHTIEFNRKAEDIITETENAYLGGMYIYIPELVDYEFVSGRNYRIKAYATYDTPAWYYVWSSNTISGSGHEIFPMNGVVGVAAYIDSWNKVWRLQYRDDPALAWKSLRGNNNGSFWGGKTIILDNSDVEAKTAVSGIIKLEEHGGTAITSAASGGADYTDFTSADHGRSSGDIIQLLGFTENTEYNGTFVILSVPDEDTFRLEVVFGTDEAGQWILAGYERVIDDQEQKAIHLKEPVYAEYVVQNYGYTLMLPTDGLYYAEDASILDASSNNIDYRFYDNDLTGPATAHPYPGEPSLKQNCQFAIILENILFTGRLVLDPGGENEIHEDWIGFSEVGCYDACPVSNVEPVPDREGGPVTGLGAIFGSLAPLKKHAIMRKDIVDPANSATWRMYETKYNRGNIAPLGVLLVGDKFIIISYDGIYLIDLNILTSSETTPLIENRISEPINDIFLALDPISEVPNIKSVYDAINTEAIFQFKEGVIWAYNIVTEKWRRIVSGVNIDVASLDENGNALIFDNSTKLCYRTSVKESVIASFKTKKFHISMERKEILRYARVHYKSDVDLYINLYSEDGSSVVKRGILRASALPTTMGIALRKRCESFILEIIDQSANTDDWEFYSMLIEHD